MQESDKLIHGQAGLPDDPEQESPVDILAAMDWHDCSTAVGMNESDVAPPLTRHDESCTGHRADDLIAGQ